MKKNNSKLTYSVASSNQKSCVAVYNACVLRSWMWAMNFKCWFHPQAQYHLHSSHQCTGQTSTTQLNRAGSRFPLPVLYTRAV